jgi:hypothetical protein
MNALNPICTPLTVDEHPAIRGSEGHVVVSDDKGNVAFLVPFTPFTPYDDENSEENARVRAIAFASAVNNDETERSWRGLA